MCVCVCVCVCVYVCTFVLLIRQLSTHGLSGIREERQQKKSRERRQVNPTNRGDEATEDVEKRIGNSEEGLKDRVAGELGEPGEEAVCVGVCGYVWVGG